MTTKDRINRFSPINLYQTNYVWYTGGYDKSGDVFFDGIKFDYGCNLLNPSTVTHEADTKKMVQQINEYTNKCITALQDTIPLPGGGDCWYCVFKTEEGKSVGDCFSDTSHLLSHFEEGYIVPALVYNAVEEAGYNTPILIISGYNCNELSERGIMGGQDMMADNVKRAIRRYLQKRLL